VASTLTFLADPGSGATTRQPPAKRRKVAAGTPELFDYCAMQYDFTAMR
jgi:hypothetical protein